MTPAELDRSVKLAMVEASPRSGLAIETIEPEQLLVDDLGLDSLGMVDLVFQLEEEHDVEVPDQALTEMRTVGDVIDLARSLVDTE